MNSKSSMDSLSYLYRIEEKLRAGSSQLSAEDIKLARQIVESFDKVWRLSYQYPELNSKLENGMFQRIFENMSAKFTNSDTNLNLICDYCDEEFPLLNNDVQYSVQMHQQTPEHESIMKNFEALHQTSSNARDDCVQQVRKSPLPSSNTKTKVCDRISATNPSNSGGDRNVQYQMLELETDMKNLKIHNHSSTSGVTSFNARGDCVQRIRQNSSTSSSDVAKSTIERSAMSNLSNNGVDRWIRGTGSGRYCVLCEAKLPNDSNLKHHIDGRGHRENDEWISITGSNFFCDLCNVSSSLIGELKHHLKGRMHKTEIWVVWEYFDFISSKNTNDASISSLISLIYSSNFRIRLSYFLNKTCIIQLEKSRYYVCSLCKNVTDKNQVQKLCKDDFLLDKMQIHKHLLTKTHATKVKEIIEKCDVNSVSFEIGFICGDMNRECFYCGAKCYGKNPTNYEAHLSSRNHQSMVKAHFQSPRFKNWEKGIILRNGLPYCTFCQLILGDGLSMRMHINDVRHRSKF